MIALLAGRQHLKEEWIKNLVQNLKEYGEVYDFPASMVNSSDLLNADLVVDFNSGVKVPEGIPHLVLDFGFLHRDRGYYQVCCKSLNNIIKEKVNSKRSLLKVENSFIKQKGPILVLGQKENDRQHGMSGPGLKQFYKNVIKDLKDKYPNNHIWFRNHPESKHSFVFSGVTNKDNVIIEELYGLAGAILTYNSTGVLPFLAQGTPVFCHNSAFYSHCCMKLSELGCEFYASPKEDRGLLFNQIVHSQFTKEELSKPELLKILIEYAKTGKVPKDWLEEVEEEPKEVAITQQQYELACEALEISNFPKARKMVKQVFPDDKFKDRESLDSFCKEAILKFKTQGSL